MKYGDSSPLACHSLREKNTLPLQNELTKLTELTKPLPIPFSLSEKKYTTPPKRTDKTDRTDETPAPCYLCYRMQPFARRVSGGMNLSTALPRAASPLGLQSELKLMSTFKRHFARAGSGGKSNKDVRLEHSLAARWR